MIIANITTETAAASPMRKYWKPYFSTSSPSTSVEFAGPPGIGRQHVLQREGLEGVDRGQAPRPARRSTRSCGRSMCQKLRTGAGAVEWRSLAQLRRHAGQAGQPDHHEERDHRPVVHRDHRERREHRSASQRISVTPHQPPVSEVMMPFGCSSSRQTTATTTTGGSTAGRTPP